MNSQTIYSTLAVLYSCVFVFGMASPLPPQQYMPQQASLASAESMPQQLAGPAPTGIQSDFDYSRFFLNNQQQNLPYGMADKKSGSQQQQQLVGNSYFGVPAQWGGVLPRQLAPKFKREYNSYTPHDKRLDEQLFSDLYMDLKPGRFEWNFNRL